MKTRGPSLLLITMPLFAACGSSALPTEPATPTSSTTTSAADTTPAAAPAAAPPTAAPAAAAAAAAVETVASAPASEASEPALEPCDGDWVCVRVTRDGKVEKRATRLIGDPKIEATWSQNTDGRTPATFQDASRPVELVLRRLPGKPGQHLAQIVLKGLGREITIDRRDGGEFGYVGFIAAEKEGDDAFLVDLRYMK